MPANGQPDVSSYRVLQKYTVSQKIAVIQIYRDVVAKLGSCHGSPLSAQAISDTIEDVFYSFSYWDQIEDALFIDTFQRSLDPHTLRKLLSCELGIGLRKIHVRSIRVLHAFLQILAKDSPRYLSDCLGENFPRISSQVFRGISHSGAVS